VGVERGTPEKSRPMGPFKIPQTSGEQSPGPHVCWEKSRTLFFFSEIFPRSPRKAKKNKEKGPGAPLLPVIFRAPGVGGPFFFAFFPPNKSPPPPPGKKKVFFAGPPQSNFFAQKCPGGLARKKKKHPERKKKSGKMAPPGKKFSPKKKAPREFFPGKEPRVFGAPLPGPIKNPGRFFFGGGGPPPTPAPFRFEISPLFFSRGAPIFLGGPVNFLPQRWVAF